MHLSNEEDLAYRRLLEMYYDTEQPIPDDLQLVSRRIRVTPEALLFVLQEFFVLVNKGWKNKRCDLVINDYHEMAEKNRRNGKKGGRPKKPKDEQENPVGSEWDANGMPVVTQVKANQEPITINHKPKRESATSVACPLDVSEQVWQDWLALRKSKKAAVTATVLEGARKEAFKLDWPLEKFLIEWCTRGSQGLKAEWIADKQQQTETVYQRSMRLKMQEAVPSIAKQAPEPYQDAADFFRTIDMESTVQLIGDKK